MERISFDVKTALGLIKNSAEANRIFAKSPEVKEDQKRVESAVVQIQKVWTRLEELAKTNPKLKEILDQQINWD